jgi:hypothetical protein
MNLLTPELVKTRLGYETDDDSYDTLLAMAMPLVTTWFEQYCDRGLAQRDIVLEATHYNRVSRVYVWAYPLVSLDAVLLDGVESDVSQYRINAAAGYYYAKYDYPWLHRAELIETTYTGGYLPTEVPEDLAQAYADCVGVKCGMTPTEDAIVSSSATGSSAIRSIGLGGGALAVAFDTSASSAKGGISGSFDVSGAPVELQNYVSILNFYKRGYV